MGYGIYPDKVGVAPKLIKGGGGTYPDKVGDGIYPDKGMWHLP